MNEENGHIYFAQSTFDGEDLVKIGFTNGDVDKRIREISGQSAVPVKLIKAMKGSMQTEKELHSAFSEYRVHHEWFRLSQSIKEFIEKPDIAEIRKKSKTVSSSIVCVDIEPNEAIRYVKRVDIAKAMNVSGGTVTDWIINKVLKGLPYRDTFIVEENIFEKFRQEYLGLCDLTTKGN